MADGTKDTTQGTGVLLKLKNVRLGVAFLLKPSEKGSYWLNAIIDPGSELYKQITAALKQAAKNKFGDDADKKLKVYASNGGQQMCFLSGERRLDKSGDPYPGTEGKFVLTASNKTRPTLLNRRGVEVSEGEIAKLFYGGARYNLSVEIYCAENGKFKGAFCQVRGVQFVEHGERLGGGAGGGIANKSEFEDLGDPDGGTEGDDLTGGDDIPF